MTNHSWIKYITVFVITAIIFASAFMLSNYLNSKKLQQVQSTEDKISLDILSNETQFQLLSESSCSTLSDPKDSVFSQELSTLADQLSYAESIRGARDAQVLSLKKYYSILEAKDIILAEKIAEKCHTAPASIIYFYSNAGDCLDCTRTGYVLDELRQEYPPLRIYSFDYNLDLSTIKTIIGIHKIKNDLPAIIIGDTVYYGFKGVDDIKKIYPGLAKLSATSTPVTATASKKK